MGSCIPFIDEQPFEERVKSLADDELLEIWEETQQLESMLCSALHTDLALAPDYVVETASPTALKAIAEPVLRFETGPGIQTQGDGQPRRALPERGAGQHRRKIHGFARWIGQLQPHEQHPAGAGRVWADGVFPRHRQRGAV